MRALECGPDIENGAGGGSVSKDGSASKVMVIDDSQTIRRTAETLLAREGYSVITASDTKSGPVPP